MEMNFLTWTFGGATIGKNMRKQVVRKHVKVYDLDLKKILIRK